MNASSQRRHATNTRNLVYAMVSSLHLSGLQRLSTESFGAVELVSTSGLVFATSRVDELCGAKDASAAQVADFLHIVNELHGMTDILPFRYGAVLNLLQMKELTEREGSVYQKRLERVESCSEINAHWAMRPIEIASVDDSISRNREATSPGGDYLRRKHLNGKLLRRMEESASVVGISLASEMGSFLKDMNVSTRQLKCPTSREPWIGTRVIVSLNLLVRRDAVSPAMDALRITELESDFPVLVSGPWPAFSFLDEINVELSAADLCQCKVVQLNAA